MSNNIYNNNSIGGPSKSYDRSSLNNDNNHNDRHNDSHNDDYNKSFDVNDVNNNNNNGSINHSIEFNSRDVLLSIDEDKILE